MKGYLVIFLLLYGAAYAATMLIAQEKIIATQVEAAQPRLIANPTTDLLRPSSQILVSVSNDYKRLNIHDTYSGDTTICFDGMACLQLWELRLLVKESGR